MATSGNDKKLYVSVAGVHTVIGGELTSSLDSTGKEIDVSSKETAWDEFIGGSLGWQASGSFVGDSTPTGEQEKLWDALVSHTLVTIFYGTIINGVAVGKMGTALITNVSESSDKDSVVSKDITFKGSGSLTRATTTTTGA